MEQIGCKECISPDCHGCNLLRLEQMLKSGKFDALMDEKRGIKTGIDVWPVVRGKWIEHNATHIQKGGMYLECSCCHEYTTVLGHLLAFCPNCGADMRPDLPKEET